MMRCLSLADELADSMGWQCVIASGAGGEQVVGPLAGGRHQRIELKHRLEMPYGHFPAGVDLLVVDHYDLDGAFETACRPWAKRIMVIDDLANRRHDCNILLDQTLGCVAETYLPLVPAGCRFLLGQPHALLRPQFAAARQGALWRRRSPVLGRLLVQFGAVDHDNETSKALEGIAISGLNLAVEVILGPAANHLDEVRSRITDMPLEAILHVGPANIAEIAARCDLAIGAAGTSAWERCCLGLPMLLVICADNQAMAAKALARAGAVRLLGQGDQLTPKKIAKALNEIAACPHYLVEMGLAAANICDGLGCQRVAAALANELGGREGRHGNC